ncbi:MAG: hypothetical protein PHZ19_01750 [Candidatus Thermoplasmatota archaeon]|nr:hypothetical protein [Candidatus Thermoplasmatota archaeon]
MSDDRRHIQRIAQPRTVTRLGAMAAGSIGAGIPPGGYVAVFVGEAPRVLSITPDNAPNSGSVNVTIGGMYFQDGATAHLERIDAYGEVTTLDGSSVMFVDSETLTCTFDITGAAVGAWDVLVVNPDGQWGILPNGFEIAA